MTQTKDSTTGERVAAGTSPYSDENKGPISDLLNLLGGYQAVFNAICVAAKPNAIGLDISPMTFAHHLLAHYAVAFPPTSRMAASPEETYRVGDFIGRQPVLCIHGSTDPNNLCPLCEDYDPERDAPASQAMAEAQARVDGETLRHAKELVEDYGGHIGDVVSKLLAALLSGSTPKPARVEE